MDDKEVANMFKCLSVEARVRIVSLLKGQTLCVNALTARLNMTQGAVSQHLRILRDAGLVLPEKRGYWVHYRLNEATLAKWGDEAKMLLGPSRPQLPVLTPIASKTKEDS